ncbi:MAG TPA: response regulator, partial [Myxococcales bacterium]|nr:response regulator [Myxococcales bacterium]
MDRILIIDDEASIRELLAMHLEERGYEVLAASTGAEGFRLAAQGDPAAIVLDMRLPDASGLDLIPELRKRAAEAPVLMITAHHDMATTILAMKAGAF